MTRFNILLLVSILLAGCNPGLETESKNPAATKSKKQTTTSRPSRPYLPGRWRLRPELLPEVVIPLSHILVLHKYSSPTQDFMGQRYPQLNSGKPIKRSKEQARELVQQIRDKVHSSPDDFAALAKKHSEDVVTVARGGSLGPTRGDDIPSSFLDALQAMQPGDVSEVVETPRGFHVIKWNPIVTEQIVSASHITIGYSEASKNEPEIQPNRSTDRTRQEALELAQKVVKEARSDGSRFTDLVHQYSDHIDSANDGDYGQWSTLGYEGDGRILEIIGELKIGEVSDPVDGSRGIEIFKRTAPIERKQYAAKVIKIFYNRFVEDAEKERKSALKESRRILSQIQQNPERFSELQGEHCCDDIRYWREGRGEYGSAQAVRDLKIGQVSRAPFETAEAFYIVKRLDPVQYPPEPIAIRFALPRPDRPNIERLMQFIPGGAISRQINVIKQQVEQTVSMPKDKQKLFSQILQKAAKEFESADRSRFGAIYRETNAELKRSLGDEIFNQYMSYLYQFVEKGLLRT